MYVDQNVLVLGLAKSGLRAAKLLHKLGARVTVNDMKPYEANDDVKELESLGIKLILGEHPEQLLEEHNIDIVVKNPGIPYTNPIVQKAASQNIPVITEVELAYQISEAEIIAITGSNGKTTTTTLIYEMLKADGKQPLLAGNIGNVACEVVQEATKEQIVVMEVSSFQLLGTIHFKPSVAVLLNIFNAHLDYHGTRENYMQAKGKIFSNQDDQSVAVINSDDQDVVRLSELSNGKKIYFSTNKEVSNGAYIQNESIWYDGEKIIDIKDIALVGKHNLENILAAICAVKAKNVGNKAIQKVLASFSGVKHRLQYVGEVSGRKFYNDSKATNILATTKALEAFSSPVVLLAGGLDRGNEFDELIPYFKHVKAVITFGQTAPKIKKAAKKAGIELIEHVDNVEQAVFAAFRISDIGDVILLSPACASWDQYKTFEERGDIFINAVHKLK
ncbi:MAG: UDP-N-acetylmuramoyl-L-alanine--D-glutamate ligase [Bacillaceae bacterium]|nr:MULTISPECIES: UDP-N-acetylmuramoyl-L-alanine--D-glutamate ligase [Aeribacillus]REJ24291.1 MAG: UDP-N-acetylmuramoyl-L-alanine--D-glutamate ligase [Bacillaceae bacterium]KZM52724.1 UDP-N-acetylmuramoylalanine--D-glutamate ligase [Aeribacillus pallidus]MED0649040.1 UDP-N-acetylmuramoyl-L-alanine--D-glutamate ligase [Aeribacillus composti]MED0714557.1 UDP-N-acetylmuramoyl-L-alanine--D-glutamate ligase [Aeribacillus composti]MED0744826.1 UDP-N-acetylmuramoyl-L-alanine--D-glutamate ligase [Aerib